MNSIEPISRPNNMSIIVAQAYCEIIYTMHIQLTFQLVITRLFSFKTYSTLRSIPTNQLQHILFKNYNNSHHCITYHSYFYHLFTHLLLHHNSNTTNSISFSRPPQLISPSFHPWILAPWPLHLTSCEQHTSINLFLCSSQTSPPFPLRQTSFHVTSRTRKHPSCLQSGCSKMRGCNFLIMPGMCRPRQPTIIDCHGIFSAGCQTVGCPWVSQTTVYRSVAVQRS